jgi:ABC-2 type transport system permease protein
VLGPLAFAAILSLAGGVPADTLLGAWVHSSGYAVSFVTLAFGGYVGFPVLAGLCAGDIFSSEDRYGTWKTVLTRSRSRGQVFAGKVLVAATLSLALVALAALSSLVAGLILTGAHPLVGLSGTLISSGESLWLLIASWLLVIPAVLAFTSLAVLFSIASRNGIVGVLAPPLVGLLMQLLALIGSGSWVHMLLVASAFDDWHGLLAAPKFYGPLVIGGLVSAAWVVASLGASWLILRRREFAGPPIGRRSGWRAPVRATLAATALILALGAATSLEPTAITRARLEPSIANAFDRLALLQEQELGRSAPAGAKLKLRTRCSRRSGKGEGPGDWSCVLVVVTPLPEALPLALTSVTYDVSVRSNGCYKADAAPASVGQQTMLDAHRRSVVNPLFTIYGCFDTTGKAVGCSEAGSCLSNTPRSRRNAIKSKGAAPPARVRARELETLHQAERRAGPRVMREVAEGERREQRETETQGERYAEESP